VDTVLYHTNQFFLDEIREIVLYMKTRHALKVIAGGTAFSTHPEGILEYIGTDSAIVGPAEEKIHGLVNTIRNPGVSNKIIQGTFHNDVYCPRSSEKTDYQKYISNDGIAGFETHKGCSSSCVYCTEANTRVAFKKVDDIINEIRFFAERGQNHFHLCDSEFNEDLDFCIEVCRSIQKSGLDLKWALYMKPANYNRRLFALMKSTGVYLITLTVDSFKKCPQYWEDIEKMVFLAKSLGIKIAIDFLTGFPYEGEDVIEWYLDMFRRIQPDTVNINTYIRLYKTLQVTRMIMNDEKLKGFLIGNVEDRTFIKPVFYNHLPSDRLKELIKGEKMFRVEGEKQGVNYSSI
jgi:tRNA A37 methylthiotransferase MiaB